MRRTTSYVIPIMGLLEGEHQFSYEVNDEFLKQFEKSPVKTGKFKVEVLLLKKSNHLEFEFDIKGIEHTICDRCLVEIDLPIEGSYSLIVKYDTNEREEDEVVYISNNSPDFDLTKYIYEFICLQVPMIKLYDCEDDPNANCDLEILNKLDDVYEEEESDHDEPSNTWTESLKNLKL